MFGICVIRGQDDLVRGPHICLKHALHVLQNSRILRSILRYHAVAGNDQMIIAQMGVHRREQNADVAAEPANDERPSAQVLQKNIQRG